jgi:fructose-1,6-bisphosphatase/inositol monophosphatase family enzyme
VAHAGTRRTSGGVDVDAVTSLVEHVAATVVTPRFRLLHDGDVREKAPGDVVTVVDTEAEAVLARGLAELLPGVPVVGEEATAADPRLVDVLAQVPLAWVVDPLDGTQAFVDGSPDHAVMVALVQDGEAVAGWVCLPQHGETFVAERGSGAYRNGERVSRGPAAADPSHLRGGISAGYARSTGVDLDGSGFTGGVVVSDRLWSGYEYTRLVLGTSDLLVSGRTWPWDHAPGAVLVREVGGVVRRLDGTEYRPDEVGEGLLAAADLVTFGLVRERLRLG